MSGVNEAHSMPSIKLRLDRLKVLMAEVMGVISVPNEEWNIIQVKFVERIGDFVKCCFCIGVRGKLGKEAVAAGVLVPRCGRIIVTLAHK